MKKLPCATFLTLVLCLAVAGTCPLTARADVGLLHGYQLPLRHGADASSARAASGSALAAALVVAPSEPDAVLRARQNLARRILAAGAGLALSAAITPIYVMPNRDPCWGSERAKGSVPLTAAAVVGALGVAMTAGGATWLGLQARRHGYYASRRERLIAMAIGALALGLGQTLQVSLFYIDQICHS